jgi:hypothetical protein
MDYPAPAPDTGRPMSAFPRRFSELPSVSFVVPDLRHDMHSGTPAAADAWIRTQNRVRPFGAAASARPITAVCTTRNVVTAHGH